MILAVAAYLKETGDHAILDEPVPYPGLADVGYLGAIPFLLAGVLVFPSRSLRNIGRARAVLDGATGLPIHGGAGHEATPRTLTITRTPRLSSRPIPIILDLGIRVGVSKAGLSRADSVPVGCKSVCVPPRGRTDQPLMMAPTMSRVRPTRALGGND